MIADENERIAFDKATVNLFGGDAMANVANTLSLMSRAVPQSGSFAKLLAICAEEVGNARMTPNPAMDMPTCANSQTVVWRNVASDGTPPCNGENWFLGANNQGAMCCFNFLDDTGMCWYCGPEDNAQLMGGLQWWATVEAPDMTPNAALTGAEGVRVEGTVIRRNR